jgi:hypothetical protein
LDSILPTSNEKCKTKNFLQNFVDEFDIIVLTETHLDNNIENRDIELDSFDKNPICYCLKT